MRLSAVAAIATALVATLTPSLHAQKVEVETVRLENGMTFLLVPRHDQPNTISAGWLAKVGSVNERPGITGISHFFEHMMFKGTNTIGTRDPKRDAEYRAKQKEIRDRINELTWTEQYARYFRGEIDDPWNAANDTPTLKELRAELKRLMDAQQGRLFGDEIAKRKAELAKADRSTDAGKQAAAALEKEIMALEAEQNGKASIVKDEFDQVYTKAGGSGMNAFTGYDQTFFFINVPSNKFELWAWMESDRLNDSVFREFYAERDVVHEERRLRTESTPTGIFQEQFDSMFWMSSGYSWPVIGWTSDLNSYTIEESLRYWDLYYRPNNLVGIVVGDFRIDEVKPTIERYFGRLQRGSSPPPPVITLEHKTSAEMRMNAEVDAQPSVEMRWHTVPFRHRDSYALDVLAAVLNGRTGRLYKSMVEGKSIASSVGAQTDTRKYAGAFSIVAETKGDATPEQLEAAIAEEIRRLQDEPITDRELQKVKNQNAAEQYRRLQSNFFLMIQLAVLESMGGWEEINEEGAKIQAVTAADVQRVARSYFTREGSAVAIYKRKQAESAGAGAGAGEAGAAAAAADPLADDAEFAKLPAEIQPLLRPQIQRIAASTDAAKLKEGLARMSQDIDAGKVPAEMMPVVEYMRRKMEERIRQLETK